MSDPKMRKVQSGQGYGYVLDREDHRQGRPTYARRASPDEVSVRDSAFEAIEGKMFGEGRTEHGPMDLLNDSRDLLGEAIDEATDALTYLHMHKRKLELEAAAEPFRLVYMAHPFGGDMRNLARATGLHWKLREEYELTHNIIAPWISECQQFEDSDPEQRRRGLAKCKQWIKRCDELWLCGVTVSKGMAEEAAFARANAVRVVDMTTRQK